MPKTIKRDAEVAMSVDKIDTIVPRIDKRVAAMNKRGAKNIIRGARKIKIDLEAINP